MLDELTNPIPGYPPRRQSSSTISTASTTSKHQPKRTNVNQRRTTSKADSIERKWSFPSTASVQLQGHDYSLASPDPLQSYNSSNSGSLSTSNTVETFKSLLQEDMKTGSGQSLNGMDHGVLSPPPRPPKASNKKSSETELLQSPRGNVGNNSSEKALGSLSNSLSFTAVPLFMSSKQNDQRGHIMRKEDNSEAGFKAATFTLSSSSAFRPIQPTKPVPIKQPPLSSNSFYSNKLEASPVPQIPIKLSNKKFGTAPHQKTTNWRSIQSCLIFMDDSQARNNHIIREDEEYTEEAQTNPSANQSSQSSASMLLGTSSKLTSSATTAQFSSTESSSTTIIDQDGRNIFHRTPLQTSSTSENLNSNHAAPTSPEYEHAALSATLHSDSKTSESGLAKASDLETEWRSLKEAILNSDREFIRSYSETKKQLEAQLLMERQRCRELEDTIRSMTHRSHQTTLALAECRLQLSRCQKTISQCKCQSSTGTTDLLSPRSPLTTSEENSKKVSTDVAIQVDNPDSVKLDELYEEFRRQLESKDRAFDVERSLWLEEKRKVIEYQKQLQTSQVQLRECNLQLNAQLHSILRLQEQQAAARKPPIKSPTGRRELGAMLLSPRGNGKLTMNQRERSSLFENGNALGSSSTTEMSRETLSPRMPEETAF